MNSVSILLGLCLAADLPSEATLPGRPQKTLAKRELPSEATLPGKLKVAAADLAHPSQLQNPKLKKLPSEAELPKGFKKRSVPPISEVLIDLEQSLELLDPSESASDQPVATQVPPNEAAPIPIGQAPASIPWLRLNMRGHVGVIRALTYTADGSRLCSAGDDKTVEVWSRFGAENNLRWAHERAIRWPVERGPRGRIHALAVAPGVIAMAGYGTTGALGEIWLVDPATGELKRALIDDEVGHRQIVVGLSFPTGRADILASQDVTGCVVYWRQDPGTGLWKAKRLVGPDGERFTPDQIRVLQPFRRFAPIVMPNEKQIIMASLLGVQEWATSRTTETPSRPRWRLAIIDVESGRQELLSSETYTGAVIALAGTPDGKRLAASDSTGNLHLWDLTTRHLASKLKSQFALGSLAWSHDGMHLVTGSFVSPLTNHSIWQHWQVESIQSPQKVAEERIDRDINAVAINSDGTEVAFSQGSDVLVKRLHGGEASDRLRGLTRPVWRVAFARNQPIYRIAVGSTRSADGTTPLEYAFDLNKVKLESPKAIRESDWLRESEWQGDWKIDSVNDGVRETHWLYFGGARVARIPLHPTLHGRPSATCWIPDREGRPYAVAVGTSIQGNIFVLRLERTETLRILRQFRGHEGGVKSLAVSLDRRYLASGSDDATVRVWNLTGFDSGNELVNRWGSGFEIRDGQLVATGVREDGPIYFRGVRSDDSIRSIAWLNQGKVVNPNQAEAMLQQLRTGSWNTQVVFDCRRREMNLEGFQMIPAWRPLASLYIAENREWAFWTPAGYYDASFDGHKLFGWQLNRGVGRLPEFFLAAQFRQALERPEVMNRLLQEGNLPAALRNVPKPKADEGQDAVLPQYRLKPRVEIVSPTADQQIAGNRVRIRAKVTVREGLELVPPKAFANGVVAPVRQLVQQQSVPGGTEFIYEWNAPLPSDPKILIQVVASTDAEAADYQSVLVQHRVTGRSKGRLYVVAAGVNDYRDAQIQRLDFAANNAQRVADVLEQSGALEAATLLNESATRPMWSLITTEYAERLRHEASADDLLVFFLSGHGIRDEQTGRYFFVSSNARYDDLKSQRFADCLSFEDFAAFSDVPCRKLVVLDTCHSGAVQQPLKQQDLKAAVRALQQDVVFTITASEGTQEAVEEKGRQLGRFTARFVEALQGAADEAARGGDANGTVTLREVSSYVQSTVSADSAGDEQQQHPTAGPIDLLDYSDFPLTQR